MTEDAEIKDLLKKSIEAQDRTTHAVRAFVRFLFIQLTAVTIASALVGFAVGSNQPFLAVIAVLVALVGIIWSSAAGWDELAMSDRFSESRAIQRQEHETSLARQREEEARRSAAQVAERAERRAAIRGSRRFKVGMAILSIAGAVVTLSAVIVVAVIGVQAANEADRAERLADLPGIYDSVIATCAADEDRAGIQPSLERTPTTTTLELRIEGVSAQEISSNGFATCVSEGLTSRDLEGLAVDEPRLQGDFFVELENVNPVIYLTFRPNLD